MDEESKLAKESQSSGIYKATFNFTNAILGSGIVGIPYALKQAGFFTGIILLLSVCLIQVYICVKLVKLARGYDVETYEDLSYQVGGSFMYYATCIFCFLFSFGALVYYSKIIHTTNVLLINFTSGKSKFYDFHLSLMTGGVYLLLVIPLSMLRDMSILSFSSIASIVVFLLVVGITFVTGALNFSEIDSSGIVYNFLNKDKFFDAVGTLCFSFVCTDSFLQIYRSLKHRTQRNWNQVVFNTFGFLGVLYGTFGVVCFSLLPDISDFALDTKSLESTQIYVVRGLFSFVIISTYPVVLFVSREYISSILKVCLGDPEEMPRRKSWFVHVAITLTLVSTSLAIGIKIKYFEIILSLTGLFSCTIAGFVIPVILIVKASTVPKLCSDFKRAFSCSSQIKLNERLGFVSNLLLPMIIFAFGLIAFAIGTPISIINYIKKR